MPQPQCPAGIGVRPAVAADIPRVAAIYAHYVANSLATFETEPPAADQMRHRHRELVLRGFPYFVAERDARIVGYAYAGTFRSRAAYAYTVEDSIYLDPKETGRGVGRVLLDALVEATARAGFRQMIAVIGDTANTASIAVHARCGFRHAGTLASVGLKFGRWVDTVQMQRALGDGDASLPKGTPG